MAVSSCWKHPGDRPVCPDRDYQAPVAQVAADQDNYRTELARLCKSLLMAVPGDHNFKHIMKLYRTQQTTGSASAHPSKGPGYWPAW